MDPGVAIISIQVGKHVHLSSQMMLVVVMITLTGCNCHLFNSGAILGVIFVAADLKGSIWTQGYESRVKVSLGSTISTILISCWTVILSKNMFITTIPTFS